MRRLATVAALATLACAAMTAPALAANATVNVGAGRTLSPSAVTVDPGDTVTWTWVGPDTDHVIASNPGQRETWQSDPGDQSSRNVGGSFAHAFTKSGSFSYVCRVHPDRMRGTVTVTGAPVASFTATPANPFTGETVTLDASASTDNTGIAKYEWDRDGNGTFETDTGAVPTTTTSLGAPGTVVLRLQVTDTASPGNVATTTRSVVVRSRNPVASFTVTPSTAAKGQSVQFDAGASTDPDDAISKHEWDLDGNGSFETDTAAEPTTSRMYSAAGPVVVGLKVTDAALHTATATRTLTISNQLPVASFVVTSPASPLSLEPVTFDASASSDPDAQPGDPAFSYRWDFENDGPLDTLASTSPTATHTYRTPGTRTVRVQVTDGEGGVAQTTRAVTIGNRPPSASFTAPERVTANGAAANFDGAGSADPDGTIAKYEWDLDGNGSFETDTGASSAASRVYPAADDEVVVRLRVTDTSGAPAETTRSLIVDPAPPPPPPPPPAGGGGGVPAGPAPAAVAPAPLAPASVDPAPVAPAPSLASSSGGSTALSVTGSTRQRAARARAVKVTVACPRRCSLSARGTIAIAGARAVRLGSVTRTLTAAGRANLTLRIAARDLGRVRRALARRRRAVATVTVLSRAGGVTRTGTRRITLLR
ncbi:MAG: PKD domain-containing protein [Solirubrobacterales bacterium]|nr:PKD domain-containing protein [Solirubrobacterales bacterium]